MKLLPILANLLLVATLSAQTRVNLPSQARNVDFSGSDYTIPFRSGNSLPSTCIASEAFNLLTDTTGNSAGLYLCAAGGNHWNTSGVSSSSSAPPWPITRTSATVLTLGGGSVLRIGATYCKVPADTASITVGSGTGTIYLFIRSNCELVAAHNIVLTSCTNCTLTQGTGYEANSFPLAQWSVTNGVLAATGISTVTPYALQPLLAGQNIQFTSSAGQTTISAANLTLAPRTRTIGYSFDGAGGVLSAGTTKYVAVPFACTLSGWNIAADSGSATVQIWKSAVGTGIPTSSNALTTSGLSLASGTSVHSTNVSDFSSVAVSAGDVIGFNLSAAAFASYVNVMLECLQ